MATRPLQAHRDPVSDEKRYSALLGGILKRVEDAFLRVQAITSSIDENADRVFGNGPKEAHLGKETPAPQGAIAAIE